MEQAGGAMTCGVTSDEVVPARTLMRVGAA